MPVEYYLMFLLPLVKFQTIFFKNKKWLSDVSLFSEGGGGGGYQFFKQGPQKILTLPLNTNIKIVTLPQP